MKKRSAKYMITGSLLLAGLFVYFVSKSCGPDLELDGTRFALFQNDLTAQPQLEPFYYSERFMNAYQPDPSQNDYHRNCNEWRTFTGGAASEKDIYALQYKTSPEAFLLAYNTNDWKPFAGNSFAQWLLRKQNRAAFDYFLLAKRAEFSFGNMDPWETGRIERPAWVDTLVTLAIQKANRNIPLFLKERYAYQALKQYYYSGKRNKAMKEAIGKMYQEYLNKSESVAADWSLLFYGLLQPNNNQRTIYLLQTFDRSDEKKVFVYQNLSLQDLQAAQRAATGAKTIELIHTVKGMKNPGRAYAEIAAVYQANPQSKYLPLLITREINKLEDWITSWQQLGFTSATAEAVYIGEQYRKPGNSNFPPYETLAAGNRRSDELYLKTFLVQLQQMQQLGKSNQSFFLLAEAHLQNMAGNYAAAKKLCSAIHATKSAMQSQQLVEATIALVSTENILVAEVKEKIADNIRQLIRLNPAYAKYTQEMLDKYNGWHEDSATAENKDDLNELMLLISSQYQKRGDIVTAGLIYQTYGILTNHYDGWIAKEDSCTYGRIAYFDRNAAPEDLDAVLAFKHKKNKTAFEQLINPPYWGKDDFYKDLKGTIQFRRKQYRQALATFETIADTFWRGNYEYVHYLHTSVVTQTYPFLQEQPAKKYAVESKKLIMRHWVQLMDSLQAATNPNKKAKLLYQLGNAYYNTCYYGKDWMMFGYGKSASELYRIGTSNYDWAWYNFAPNNSTYQNTYYKCSDAITAYTQALQLSTDRELKAKCLLMLADCNARRHETLSGFSNRWSDKPYLSPYLGRLQQAYGKTAVYQDGYMYCPDVSEFAKK